jgi:hypothetical protein
MERYARYQSSKGRVYPEKKFLVTGLGVCHRAKLSRSTFVDLRHLDNQAELDVLAITAKLPNVAGHKFADIVYSDRRSDGTRYGDEDDGADGMAKWQSLYQEDDVCFVAVYDEEKWTAYVYCFQADWSDVTEKNPHARVVLKSGGKKPPCVLHGVVDGDMFEKHLFALTGRTARSTKSGRSKKHHSSSSSSASARRREKNSGSTTRRSSPLEEEDDEDDGYSSMSSDRRNALISNVHISPTNASSSSSSRNSASRRR